MHRIALKNCIEQNKTNRCYINVYLKEIHDLYNIPLFNIRIFNLI